LPWSCSDVYSRPPTLSTGRALGTSKAEAGTRRQAVAEKLARDNGLTYDPGREILITDGATCGIATALAVLVQPGDEVLVPDPIYDAYASPVVEETRYPASVAPTSSLDELPPAAEGPLVSGAAGVTGAS